LPSLSIDLLKYRLSTFSASPKYYSNSFWWNFIGKKISNFQVLKQKPQSVLHEDLPNEVGLIITVESGESFLMYHHGCGDLMLHETLSWIQDELDDGSVYPL
jgi:hypothetical protein